MLATLVLLFLMTGSVVIPVKALVMNVLSLGAALGVTVWILEDVHLENLLRFTSAGAVENTIPLLVLAFGFGLSMDYEVFLVTRIREAYGATGDTAGSVADGLAASARVITSGALIMVAVFLSFVVNPSPFVQMIGLGLATAVALDATVVRLVLVPSTMVLLGRWNWWLPGWLDRLLPAPHRHDVLPTVPVPPAPSEREPALV